MERVPKTVDEAVDMLLVEVSEEDRKNVAGLDRDRLNDLHFSLGIFVRNRFGLQGANTDLIASCRGRRSAANCGYSTYHPDEASSIIIEAFWKRLQA